MEMKKINSGRLRAIVYDAPARMLQVQLDDGSTLKYGGVSERMSGEGLAARGRQESMCSDSK